MPTRFYFDNDTAAHISPAFDAAWEQTGGADRKFSPRKQTLVGPISALANQAAQTVPITTTQQILSRQYITEPIPFRVRMGGADSRISMVLRGLENATTNNVFLAFVLRAVDINGGNPRALGSVMTNSGTEFVATAATRIFSLSNTLTATTLDAGDRLVLEIGGHAQAPSAAGSYTYRYGIGTGGDFALTSGLTTDLAPWWELEQDLWPVVFNNQKQIRGADGISVSESWR